MKMLDYLNRNADYTHLENGDVKYINLFPDIIKQAIVEKKRPVCLYIVDCGYDHFYIGITAKPTRRELQHRGILKGGAYFTSRHGFVNFRVLAWFENRKEASKAEQHYTHKMRRRYKTWTIAGAKIGHLD